ncbi:formin-like protein 11 [Schistocerca americana]|uniref:formin-like protein 11 n=1 Tax=Schistocerca americana TaxID=7009 RepID=UPI001F4F4631|nr:formin-like protein 11 [Schistocerca americana]XP_049961763.1 uncharacterized protein LOC126481847 [Schistocerca serialis cubense]
MQTGPWAAPRLCRVRQADLRAYLLADTAAALPPPPPSPPPQIGARAAVPAPLCMRPPACLHRGSHRCPPAAIQITSQSGPAPRCTLPPPALYAAAGGALEGLINELSAAGPLFVSDPRIV